MRPATNHQHIIIIIIMIIAAVITATIARMLLLLLFVVVAVVVASDADAAALAPAPAPAAADHAANVALAVPVSSSRSDWYLFFHDFECYWLVVFGTYRCFESRGFNGMSMDCSMCIHVGSERSPDR